MQHSSGANAPRENASGCLNFEPGFQSVYGAPIPGLSPPRRRGPSTPRAFGSIADLTEYWVPAFAGTTAAV